MAKITEKITDVIRHNKKEKVADEKKAFEEREDLKKLLFYIIIVNLGQGENVIRMLKRNHSSAQFIQVGEGTATKQIRSILSIEDSRKEIIYSLIRDDFVPDLKKELDAYFAASKRNAGVAFTINVQSVVGVKLYKFLTQTVRG